jgi:Pyruvate/2-oxoacid:ferredoxin oxidoreductase gamma subunit
MMGIIILLFLLLIMSLANNVIEMGERFYTVHPLLSKGFYVAIGIFVIWVVAVPIGWMLKAPVYDYSVLLDGQKEHIEPGELKKFKQSLVKDESDIEKLEGKEGDELKEALVSLIAERERYADEAIVQSSLLTFLTTAISPNGLIDVAAVIYYNVKMIGSMIRLFGIRPSLINILKIFRNVFLTAFVVNQLEELEINEYMEEMLESFGDVAAGKLLSKTMDSLIQGTLSAFVTLKIGYAAKAVLLDPRKTRAKGFRRYIRKRSRQTLAREVLPRSIAAVPRGFGKAIEVMLRRMTREATKEPK